MKSKSLFCAYTCSGGVDYAALCSEDCFSILDTASTPFQLKMKEALLIHWEKP